MEALVNGGPDGKKSNHMDLSECSLYKDQVEKKVQSLQSKLKLENYDLDLDLDLEQMVIALFHKKMKHLPLWNICPTLGKIEAREFLGEDGRGDKIKNEQNITVSLDDLVPFVLAAGFDLTKKKTATGSANTGNTHIIEGAEILDHVSLIVSLSWGLAKKIQNGGVDFQGTFNLDNNIFQNPPNNVLWWEVKTLPWWKRKETETENRAADEVYGQLSDKKVVRGGKVSSWSRERYAYITGEYPRTLTIRYQSKEETKTINTFEDIMNPDKFPDAPWNNTKKTYNIQTLSAPQEKCDMSCIPRALQWKLLTELVNMKKEEEKKPNNSPLYFDIED